MDADEKLIEDIMAHLDNETNLGAVRMSVNMDEGQQTEKEVSHKCCRAYGKDATETVNLLDMYSDSCNN
ncbi:MAG: hypothetical protein K6G07_03010 [Lachnospiraceae bacterium]|nr:hypothetical protein [Lachnospiraceae bacterium]